MVPAGPTNSSWAECRPPTAPRPPRLRSPPTPPGGSRAPTSPSGRPSPARGRGAAGPWCCGRMRTTWRGTRGGLSWRPPTTTTTPWRAWRWSTGGPTFASRGRSASGGRRRWTARRPRWPSGAVRSACIASWTSTATPRRCLSAQTAGAGGCCRAGPSGAASRWATRSTTPGPWRRRRPPRGPTASASRRTAGGAAPSPPPRYTRRATSQGPSA
mmetsp:Transcript_14953/g.47632  ORF Transcript_14953/g.47632 Transcript_14953/m.47632 type:complete len:214 (+) Transcript_14953:747-1388(+)